MLSTFYFDDQRRRVGTNLNLNLLVEVFVVGLVVDGGSVGHDGVGRSPGNDQQRSSIVEEEREKKVRVSQEKSLEAMLYLSARGQCYKTVNDRKLRLFLISYTVCPGKLSQPSLIFAGKARSPP